MGILASKFIYARYRNGSGRRNGSRKTAPYLRRGRSLWIAACLVTAFFTNGSRAETIRIATYHPELERKGPGLLLRDILLGDDPQVLAVADIIVQNAPDILLLTAFDYDLKLLALRAFADQLRKSGIDYPYIFALQPNSGLPTGLDMNGDGRTGTPHDAQGFGEFNGSGGLAVLSRYPIRDDDVRDFSKLLWRDFPDHSMPMAEGAYFPSEIAADRQRLSATSHWDVPIELPSGTLHLFAFHAGTPAFDGKEGRNARRNRDEVRFWQAYIDGDLQQPYEDEPFIILGDANLDPNDGEGHRQTIRDLLNHPKIQALTPTSMGAIAASKTQGGVNSSQIGDPAADTADWREVNGPGNLRVDYALPSMGLDVAGTGVFWPAPDDPLHRLLGNGDAIASRHFLVWVDLRW